MKSTIQFFSTLILIAVCVLPFPRVSYCLDPESVQQILAIYENAINLKESGEYAEAEKITREGLKRFPESEDLMLVLADTLNRVGRSTEAVRYYKLALAKQPKAPQILSALCSAQVNTGEYKEAVLHCERAQQADPKDGTVWFNLGKSYAALGEYPKAKANFAKYVKEFAADDPNDHFVLQAKSEQERLTAIVSNRVTHKAPTSDKRVGFSAEEEEIIREVIRRYTKLGLTPEDAESTVTLMRPAWMSIPGPARRQNIIEMRDGLPN